MPRRSLSDDETRIISDAFIHACGVRRDNVRKLRRLLRDLGIACLESDADLARLTDAVCEDSAANRLLTLPEFVRLASIFKLQHYKLVTAGNTDVVEAFLSVGGCEDLSGDVSSDLLRMRFRDVSLAVDIDRLIAQVDTDGSGKIEYEEFVELMTNSAMSACVLDREQQQHQYTRSGDGEGSDGDEPPQEREVLDPFCLFRRLGGDPDDPAKATLSKATVLEALPTAGLDDYERRNFEYFAKEAPCEHFTFECFCREVVDRVDLGFHVPERTAVLREQLLADQRTLRRHNSVGHPHPSSAADAGGLKSAIKLFDAVTLLEGSLSTGLRSQRQPRPPLPEALRPDCTFPRPLAHCLGIRYSALKWFETRMEPRASRLAITPLRFLACISKVLRMLVKHRATCRACRQGDAAVGQHGQRAGAGAAAANAEPSLLDNEEAFGRLAKKSTGLATLRPHYMEGRLRDKSQGSEDDGEASPPPWRGGGRAGLNDLHQDAFLDGYALPPMPPSQASTFRPVTCRSGDNDASQDTHRSWRLRSVTPRYLPIPDPNTFALQVIAKLATRAAKQTSTPRPPPVSAADSHAAATARATASRSPRTPRTTPRTTRTHHAPNVSTTLPPISPRR